MKGEVTITTIGLALLGAIAILIVWGAFAKVFGAFFSNEDTCKDSENTFNVLTQFVEKYVDGTYTVEQSLPLHLGEECVVIGFSKEDKIDLVSRPNSCIGESCLCLCSFDKEKSGEDAFNCNLDNQCKPFDIKYFKGGSDGKVKIEKFSDELDARIVYLNREEETITITTSPHVLNKFEISDINNKAYIFFDTLLEQGSGLYQPTGIFDQANYVRVIDDKTNLNILTYNGLTPIAQNDLIFSGNLYYVSVIDTNFPRGICLDTFPHHCVTVSGVKFMFTLVDVPNFYFNYVNLNYGNPYQRYNPNSDEFGVDIGEGYIYYDGTDFYGFNFATTDRQTLEQFINVVGGIKDTKKDTEPIVDPTYGADYVFNSDYDLENQKEVVQQAEKIGVPTQLALGLSLYESGRFEHIVKGEVLIGSDKHGYGLMQIDDRFHPGCFENPFFEDRGICDKADSCSSSDVKELSCNIGAGLTLLRDNYDKCLSIKGKTYQCHELNVRYYGWDCALRFYNGWGCNYPGVEEYVTRVKEKMKEFEPKVV